MLFGRTKRPRNDALAIAMFVTAGLLPPAAASADMITFETTPSGATPLDDALIPLGTGYTTNDGVTVTFGFDTNNDGAAALPAAFEDTLDEPATGAGAEPEYGYCTSNYGSFGCTADQAAPGYEAQLGDFFIRASGSLSDWDSFIIQYDAENAVTAASGEIWDIDRGNAGFERFDVSVYDGAGGLLATQTSPRGKFEHNPESLDAKPWAWTFSGLSDIDKIVFTRVTDPGAKSYFPLGFNNFNPTSNAVFVPEASSALLLSLGLLSWATMRGRLR